MSQPITWLSTGEAAERLGVTPRTLYRLINAGQLPAYRLGRVIRLQEQEVEEFITRSRIKPGELEHLLPEGGAHDGGAPDDDGSVGVDTQTVRDVNRR